MVKPEKPAKRRRIVRKIKQEPSPLDQKSGNRNGVAPLLPFRIILLIKRLRGRPPVDTHPTLKPHFLFKSNIDPNRD
jgi:hypothetical protein